jgi:hypothetical protein
MKLTWFAGTTVRIHIGGEILVADANLAPSFVDKQELQSGADRSLSLSTDDASLPIVDPAKRRARPSPKLIDDAPIVDTVHLQRIGPGAILIDAIGEPPLVLIGGAVAPRFGRWADDAVVVLFGTGEAMVATGVALLDTARPRLIALAASEPSIDLAIEALRDHLGGAALVSLEPALALEV